MIKIILKVSEVIYHNKSNHNEKLLIENNDNKGPMY